MALFTIINPATSGESVTVSGAQTAAGTVTPIRAINITPAVSTSPTKVDKSGLSTVITIKPDGVGGGLASPTAPASLNSASINASLNAALSSASLVTSPTTTSTPTSMSTNENAPSPGSVKDMSLNESSQSDSSSQTSGSQYTHSEPWQKAEVWRYFKLTEDPVNGRRTICKMCGKGLSYNVRTTSTMRNHMKKKHPEIVIHNIMKPRRPRTLHRSYVPYVLNTTAIGGKSDSKPVQIGGVTVKEEPADDNEEGITSEYIDNLLGSKQTGTSSTTSAVSSAKGVTLSQALAQARAPPAGRQVLRMIRPAPPKIGTSVTTTATTTPTVSVRAVTSTQPQFTIPAPAGVTQPAFPGLTPILTAAPQGSSAAAKVTQTVTRQPPPLRPAPGVTNATNVAPTRSNPVGTLTLPLTIGGTNVVRPVLIAPHSDSTPASTLGPQIAQTFSLRNVFPKGATSTSTPVATGNKRSRTPVRIGPTSPIVISPTPSPDVDNNDNGRTATETKQPEFSSWKQRQSAEKKELVTRLRETLFKFCEDNLEYSKCLHIRGDVLVIYDDNSLSAEFDKHLHGDEIAKDKRIRSQNEALRVKKNQSSKSLESSASQPIIQSVTSLANLAASTAGSAATTQSGVKSSASKRAAGLDRIIDSWYARPEEGGGSGGGSNNDSDADSLGVGQDDPSDSDWYPPAKKARGVKRKSSVPTRIIKQSQLVPSDEDLEQDALQAETSSVNSQEAASVDESQEEEGDADAGEGSQVENRATMVIPITIAPESDDDDYDAESETNERTNETAEDGEENQMNNDEVVCDDDNDDGDVLMIDESVRPEVGSERTGSGNKETGSVNSDAAETESQRSDASALRKLANILNGETIEENMEDDETEEDAAPTDNQSKNAERTEEKSAANISNKDSEVLVENGVEETEDQHSDEDDEFSDDEEKDDGDGNPEGTDGEEDMEEEDGDKSERTSQSKEITTTNVDRGKGKTRKKDSNYNDTKEQGEKGAAAMANGNASESEKKSDRQKSKETLPTREKSGERNKRQTQSTIQTRKKSTDSRTTDTRKSVETRSAPTKVSPGKTKGKAEVKTQKPENKPAEQDPRIAPVERPNTRRLSRRITREDDDFVT